MVLLFKHQAVVDETDTATAGEQRHIASALARWALADVSVIE
jgi:hypothetical protein